MRLFQGKIIEPEADGDSEEGEDEESEGGTTKKREKEEKKIENDDNNEDETSFRDFNHTFKSRKALNSVISDRRPPPAII